MMRFVGLGLCAVAALLLAVNFGGTGNVLLLIVFLAISGFFGMLALVQYDRDRNYQQKFGERSKRIWWGLSGNRWLLVLGLTIVASLITYFAMSAGLFSSLGPPTPAVAQAVPLAASGSMVAEAPAPAPQPAGASAGNPAPLVAQAPAQESAAPALVPVTSTAAAVNHDELAVRASIEAWGKAWSVGDVDEYLASYSDAFLPANGMTRSHWEATRRLRVQKGRNVNVSIKELAI